MAGQEGFEPPTIGFGIQRSTVGAIALIMPTQINFLISLLCERYAFAYLDLDTALWHKIQSLPKVGRFIGEAKKPTPLSEKDINLILEKVQKRAAPKPKIFFDNGENVRITEGPFANFTGIVEEYDMIHGKLKLNVSIFGRSTPVEILYSQVEKIV